MEKHLSYIQNAINRMANNSFLIKGWTITFISLLFILSLKDSNYWLLVLSLLPLICFWCLDAFYLRQERLFRELYNGVRLGEIKDSFTMDTRLFKKKIKYISAFFSKAIAFLYITIILLNVLLQLLVIRGTI